MSGELITGMVATWPPALLVGVLIGRHIERHKETTMEVTDRFATGMRAWYGKWAPTFFVVNIILAVLGIYLGYSALVDNQRQDEAAAAAAAERDRDNRELLRCFDRYAAKSSQASRAVRQASIEVDKATTLRDDALNAEGIAFKNLVADLLDEKVKPEAFQHLLATLEVRADTSSRLDKAQDKLDEAREQNPVPPPPSDFCDVTP